MIENKDTLCLIENNKSYIEIINKNLTNLLKVYNKDESIVALNHSKDIDGIIDCLQDLEDVRFKAHEIWETETIKFEALKNKLLIYPIEITAEIQEAIKAARGLNEETIRTLKESLEKINSNIDRHSNDLHNFSDENDNLIPQFEQMKMKHEESVAVLNKHLSKKADKQIELNEIRNIIKNDNENIIELEEDVFNLKETMIRDRATAREEKKRLTLETNKTQQLLNVQNQKNEELNKIYQNLKHEATETSMTLSEKLTVNQNYIKEIKKINKELNVVDKTIENLSWSNEKLKHEIENSDKVILESKEVFDKWKSQIDEQVAVLSDSVKVQKQIMSDLQEVKDQETTELEKTDKMKNDTSAHLKAALNKLKEINEKSAKKMTDMAQLEYEMEEMEKNIITSKENHEATVSGMNSQVTNLNKQLEKERKERIQLQESKSHLQEEINLFRTQHMRLMRDINTKINNNKSEHSRLTSSCHQLKKQIKEDLEESENLKLIIEKTEEEWSKECSKLSSTIDQLAKEIEKLENEENQRQLHLTEMEPKLKELQQFYDTSMENYEKLKKNFIGLKSRKIGLEDAMKRATINLEKETATLQRLEEEKKIREINLDEQLQIEAKDRSEIEKKIYVNGCKISTVKEEISRLKQENDKMDNKSRVLRDSWERAMIVSGKLKQEISGQKCILKDGWKNDQHLENIFKNDEMETIDKLKEILKNTEKRQVLISNISDNLFDEINLFDQFLSNIGSVSLSKQISGCDNVRDKRMINDTIEQISKLNSQVHLSENV